VKLHVTRTCTEVELVGFESCDSFRYTDLICSVPFSLFRSICTCHCRPGVTFGWHWMHVQGGYWSMSLRSSTLSQVWSHCVYMWKGDTGFRQLWLSLKSFGVFVWKGDTFRGEAGNICQHTDQLRDLSLLTGAFRSHRLGLSPQPGGRHVRYVMLHTSLAHSICWIIMSHITVTQLIRISWSG